MEKKFDIIELEIDWEGPGPRASRPIPRSPAIPTRVDSEAEQADADRVAAPTETAKAAPAPASVPAEAEIPASNSASAAPDDGKATLESAAAPAEGEAEMAELEELEELEEVEELDDSFLEPVDEASGVAAGQNDPGKPA